jgi:ribosomal protein S13
MVIEAFGETLNTNGLNATGANMKFNTQRFFRVFSVGLIIMACFFMAGCTAAWLTAVSGMLPTLAGIASAIVSFVLALEGKTVSSSFTAAVKKWQQNVATEIANAQTIIAALKQNATSTGMSQFQTVMQGVLNEFNSILSGVDITDSATVAKLTQLVGLGVAAANAILAFIPLALSKLVAKTSAEEMKHYDEVAASTTRAAENTIRETYVTIVTQHTVNADVNSALDSLPKSLS